MLSSCLPVLFFPQIAFKAFLNSHLFLGIGLPVVSACLSLVFRLSPHVFHLSPSCVPVLFQMLFPVCHLIVSCLSCTCSLLIVSGLVPDVLSRFFPTCLPLNPTTSSRLPDSVPPYFLIISRLLANRFRAASDVVFQLASTCTP